MPWRCDGVVDYRGVALGAPVARRVARARTDEQCRLRIGNQPLRRSRSACAGSGRFHSSGPRSTPSAVEETRRSCRAHARRACGAMRALVNSHCSSRARARSKPSRMRARAPAARPGSRAATAACAAAHRSGGRAQRARIARAARASPARLSMVINSTPGSSAMRRASVRPMIQVSRVAGQARCSVRTTGTTWQVSPIAESRRMHRLAGGCNGMGHAEDRCAGRSARKCGTNRFAAARCYMTPPERATPSFVVRSATGGRSRGEVREPAEGRGAAVFIDADARALVLRHYRRGGWHGAAAAAIATSGAARHYTRSFVEWHLLYVMHRAGLPVPVPIAAALSPPGRYSYTARPADRADSGEHSSLAAPTARRRR